MKLKEGLKVEYDGNEAERAYEILLDGLTDDFDYDVGNAIKEIVNKNIAKSAKHLVDKILSDGMISISLKGDDLCLETFFFVGDVTAASVSEKVEDLFNEAAEHYGEEEIIEPLAILLTRLLEKYKMKAKTDAEEFETKYAQWKLNPAAAFPK